MKKLLASALVVSIAGTQLGGCENMNMDMGPTGQGAALGALTGGVLGAAVGNRNNAALGAVLGAVAGAIIANSSTSRTPRVPKLPGNIATIRAATNSRSKARHWRRRRCRRGVP